MKRLILTALLILSVLLIAGCDKAELVPLTGSDPQVSTIYVDGRRAALSTLADTMVAVSGVQTDNGLFLHVGYNNLSQRLIDVAPENISVQAVDRNGYTTNLRVYRAEEYLDQVRDARTAEIFFRAFSTLTHHENTVQTRTRVHSHGRHGYSYYWTTTTHEHPAIDDLFELAEDARDYSRDINALEESLLKRTTLMPNQNLEGLVVVQYDPRYSSRLVVTVPVDIYLHRVEFVID